MSVPETIAEYIDAQPQHLRQTLEELVDVIRKVAPHSSERIAHRMPCFYEDKTFLCGFAVFKKHIGFYPGGEPVKLFAEQLSGYKTSTGTVQFPIGQSINFELVADMIRWRLDGHLTLGKYTTI